MVLSLDTGWHNDADLYSFFEATLGLCISELLVNQRDKHA